MLRCKHCGQISESEEAYNNHQKTCKKNPKINGLSLEEKQLLNHYIYLYPDVYTHLYTETSNKYLMTERETKGYSYALAHAKRDVLEKLIALDEPKQIANNVWSCPICKLHIKDMGAHVIKVHNKPWDEFVSEYSWNSPKVFYDEDHRKNLRKNKIHYYNETDAGAQRKKLQSEKISGNNNPACRDEVKLKISESRKGQHMSIKNKENISKSTTSALYSKNAKSYGYTFWSYVDGKEMRFRSKCEYIVYLMFNYYGFSVEYEPYKIEYVDPSVEYKRHYMVDFVLGNRLFEVKPSIADFSKDIKYTLVQNQLSKINRTLEVITPGNFIDIMNIDSNIAKPQSYFEDILIHKIKCGECRLEFPALNPVDFYANSKFVKKIGGLEVINKGRLLYENKKNS